MMISKINYELINGSDKQCLILFELLKSRKYSISHKMMPTYEEHKNFVNNNPYRFWYLISKGKHPIGTIYAKEDNSIGLNIDKEYHDFLQEILNFIQLKYEPLREKASMVPSYFYINVASNNIEMKKLLLKYNYTEIQVSYQI